MNCANCGNIYDSYFVIDNDEIHNITMCNKCKKSDDIIVAHKIKNIIIEDKYISFKEQILNNIDEFDKLN